VFFLHCDRCQETFRGGILDRHAIKHEPDIDLEAFHAAHGNCSLRMFEPTGRSSANGPWHEPMTERCIEVRDRDGLAVAVAIGSRSSIEDGLAWRIEQMALEEEIEIALDRELYWDIVDRALRPLHIPQRQIAAWANRVDNFLRTVGSTDCVVLYDDTRRPDQSAGSLTLTARTPLEASLRTFGFDAATEERLLALFNDSEFPPLRITRKVFTRRVQRMPRYAEARLDSPDPLV